MWRAKISGEVGTNDGQMIIAEEVEELLFWKVVALDARSARRLSQLAAGWTS